MAGLDSGEIDFSGDLTPTEERRRKYYMTEAIAQGTLKSFRQAGSPLLSAIAEMRPVRLAMFEGAVVHDYIASSQAYEAFETVYVNDTASAYELLKSGAVDAFFDESVHEAAFDIYGDIVSSDFSPLLYNPVSLATFNPELNPVISVIQKALINGGTTHLAELYKQGRRLTGSTS